MNKEAAWAIANLVDGGSPDQIATMVEIGGIEGLLPYLLHLDANDPMTGVILRSAMNSNRGIYMSWI